MLKHIFFPCLLLLISPVFQNPLQAATLKLSETQVKETLVKTGKGEGFGVFKINKTKQSWFAKIKSKFERKIKKAKQKPGRENAKKHLFICFGLVVLSIIAFALSGQGQVFSILGSVFAIGAAVFFVLWLLNFLGKI